MAQHKTQEGDGMRTLHVRVDPVVLDRFREVVEVDHRTVSQDVRRYIEQRVSDADETQVAA